jgi:hypothetical protein
MSRLILSTALTGAAVHAALVEATRPELTLTAQTHPVHGLVGELNMKNRCNRSLVYLNGCYSCALTLPTHSFTTLRSVGNVRPKAFFNKKACFDVLQEFFWNELGERNLTMTLDAGRTSQLALVQFGFADTASDLCRRAQREARLLDLSFTVECQPMPRFLPNYIISHQIPLAEIPMTIKQCRH